MTLSNYFFNILNVISAGVFVWRKMVHQKLSFVPIVIILILEKMQVIAFNSEASLISILIIPENHCTNFFQLSRTPLVFFLKDLDRKVVQLWTKL